MTTGRIVLALKLLPAWLVMVGLGTIGLVAVSTHFLDVPHVRVVQGFLLASAVAAVWLVATASTAHRSLTRITGRVALVTLGVLVLVNAGWSVRFSLLKRDLQAAGVPTSLAGVPAPDPDAQYAEREMDAIFVSLTGTGKAGVPTSTTVGELVIALHGNPMLTGTPLQSSLHRRPADAGARIDKLIAQHPEFFKALDGEFARMIDRSTRYSRRDYSEMAANPWMVELPTYAKIVNLARAYRVQADRQALRGDLAGAWRSVDRIARLAELMATDHFLIAKMIAVANGGIAASAAVGLLANGAAPPPAATIARLASLDMAKAVADGFAGEGAAFLDQRRWIKWRWTRGGADWISRSEFVFGKIGGFTGVFDAALMRQYRMVMLPVASATGWAAQHGQSRDDIYHESRQWALPAVMGEANFSALFQKGTECRARLRMAAVASLIHTWKKKQNRWPASLKEISASAPRPDVFNDPFGPGWFAYAVDSRTGGYTLSSVGPWGDGTDSKLQRMEIRLPLPAAPTTKR